MLFSSLVTGISAGAHILALGWPLVLPQASTSAFPPDATGQVLVRLGLPAEGSLPGGALIYLRSASGDLEKSLAAESDRQVVFRGVPLGEYRIEVIANGFKTVQEEAAVLVPGVTAYVFAKLTPPGATQTAVGGVSSPGLIPNPEKKKEKKAPKGVESRRFVSADPPAGGRDALSPRASKKLARDRPSLPSPFLYLHEYDPVVDSGLACALPEVLQATAQRVLELAENLQRIAATERIEHFQLTRKGELRRLPTLTYDYVASVNAVRPGLLSVQEDRRARGEVHVSPTGFAARGLAASAFIFHPYLSENFDMQCVGLTEWNGQAAWYLRFHERQGLHTPFRMYKTESGAVTPVRIKGRAWIAANNYEIFRLETDLAESVPELLLKKDQMIIEYRPVRFVTRKIRLWLPALAEFNLDIWGRRYHQVHHFSNFLLFTVDAKHQIKEIRESRSSR